MRKLKLEMQVSADGFAATHEGGTDWMVWAWGPDWGWDEALRRHHVELNTSTDCVLLSRKMAEEGFHAHWAQVSEPADPQYAFASAITRARKIVFSTTLTDCPWPRTELAKGDLKEVVQDLKRAPGKDILAYGGPTFASALVDAGLVDEMHIFVNPTFLGTGRPMFGGLTQPRAMRLVDAKAFACGVTVQRYALPA
ncbi:MAG: dihydrofolate reductase family protein [Pseudomonadota bacterium]